MPSGDSVNTRLFTLSTFDDFYNSNAIYFHGGETAGYNSFIGHDIVNRMTLIVWTNLPVSLDNAPTANALMVKVLDQIYTVSPLRPS